MIMDSSLEGIVCDSSKRDEMSVEEKRKLVHELAKNSSDLAFEALQKWTCQEILQILSEETGKERKYKGLAKAKIISILLKIITEKKEEEKKVVSDENGELPLAKMYAKKRRRKNPNPSRFLDPMSVDETKEEATFMSSLSSKDKEKQLVVKDRPEEAVKEEDSSNCGFGLEQCVKMVRQLECSGHLERSFRLKFLSWFSLKAKANHMIIMKTYIGILQNNPKELAEQIVHTFSESMSRELENRGGGL